MVLANYYGLLMINDTAAYTTRNFDPTTYAQSLKIRNLSNSAMTSFGGGGCWGDYSLGSMQTSDILIGSGSAPAKLSDYCLQVPIETSKYNVAMSEPKIEYDGSTGQFFSTFSIVVTCTFQSGISISEWGIKRSNYLIYREVFETPFEIGMGETLTFKIRTSINTPLAD